MASLAQNGKEVDPIKEQHEQVPANHEETKENPQEKLNESVVVPQIIIAESINPIPIPATASITNLVIPEPLPIVTEPITQKRYQIINEIYVTEQHYVSDLQTVVKVFMNPLKQANIISDIQVEIIFGGIEKIQKYHERFLHEMQERLKKSNSDQPFGDLLLQEVRILFFFMFLKSIF